MSEQKKRVAIIGGHTEVAKALFDCIEERELALEVRRFTTTENIDKGLELLGPETLEFAELFVIAAAGTLADGIAKGAVASGRLVLDVTGEQTHDKARLVYPDLDAAVTLQTGVVNVLPVGLAGPIAGAIRALAARGPLTAVVSTYESAAVAGRAGMDELMEQTRAVFTLKDPDTIVFGDRLAFSCLPAFDGIDDATLDDQITEGLGDLDLKDLRVRRIVVPTMSADAATVQLELTDPITKAGLVAALKAARGLRYVERPPTSIDANDRDDALVSALEVDERHVGLWVVADRLRRGSVTGAALLLERWLAAAPADSLSATGLSD